MNGMSCSFEDYLKRLLLLGDTNLLGTIKYYYFAETARRVFGSAKIVAMEAIEDDENEVLRFFDAPGASRRLPRENSGMPGRKFANFRELYAPFGDTLGDDDFNVLSPADRLVVQTNGPYYAGVLAGTLAKEQTLGALRSLAFQMPDRPEKLCFEISAETRKLLTEYVAPSNAMLKKHYDVDTDDYEYDLF
jgi:hypothetical protein